MFSSVFSMFWQSKTSDHIQNTYCLFSVDKISLLLIIIEHMILVGSFELERLLTKLTLKGCLI